MNVLQTLRREYDLSSVSLQKPEEPNIKRLIIESGPLNSDQYKISSVASISHSNQTNGIMTTPLTSKSVQSNVISQRKYQDPLGQYYRALIGIAYTKYKINNISFYCCVDCKQYMKSFNAICNHINKHRNVTPYKCDLCVRQYTTRIALNRHFKQKHCNDIAKSTIRYDCPICHKEFVDKQVFYIHLRTEISNQSIDASAQAIEANLRSQSIKKWIADSMETGSELIQNRSQSILTEF